MDLGIFFLQFLKNRVLMHQRVTVDQHEVFMPDADHIMVKHSGIDCVRMLLRDDAMRRIETMSPNDRFAGQSSLPGREFLRSRVLWRKRIDPINKEVDTRLALSRCESCVVGSSFVLQVSTDGQR